MMVVGRRFDPKIPAIRPQNGSDFLASFVSDITCSDVAKRLSKVMTASVSHLNEADEPCPHRAVLGLMAKYWAVGQVKTRLGATIGLSKSAEIHKLFVAVLTDRLNRLPLAKTVAVAPSEKQKAFAEQIPGSWQVEPQTDGDLGNRMLHWFTQHLRTNPSAVESAHGTQSTHAILIGADCPTITCETIAHADRLLETHDLVLGPALDGGYYLIGLSSEIRSAHRMLFDQIAWSTDDVLETTLQRAREAGLSFALLEPMEDIDDIASLQRLRSVLQESENVGQSLLKQIDAVLGGVGGGTQ